MKHPFLDTSFEIKWTQLDPARIETDISLALEKAQEQIDAITDLPDDSLNFENTFLAMEGATEALSRAWSYVGHLDSVMNSPDLRKAYNAMLPKVTAFYSRIPLNAALWAKLKQVAESDEVQSLDAPARRFLDETVADFHESGADLPDEQKAELEDLQGELSAATQKFSENALDSTNAFELVVKDEARLSGLPESAREAARQSALKKGYGTEEEPQWRFTLQAPSFVPAMKFLDDDDLRKALYEGFTKVASEGEHDNLPLIRDILELRQRKAEMLGKEHFPDLVLQRRMAKNGRAALDFIEDLHAKTRDAFRKENDELVRFKADTLDTAPLPLTPWEIAYWAEKLRKSRFDFDEEDLKPYFPIEKVLHGLFTISQRVFGITIRERTGDDKPETWHEEVKFYDILDGQDDTHIGSFYTDWFPRESKRSGAWMNYLVTGDREPGHYTPHLGLMCGNLNPPVGDKPALLTHSDVETIFHEFGHLLHHLLGDVRIKSLNGVNVAWDFVELPSQIMENWCWERESLDLFARHYVTDNTIPEELFQKMISARNFHAARFQMRQLLFGKTDLELHLHPEKFVKADIDAKLRELTRDYTTQTKPEPASNIRQFGHLFSDPIGYAAGYYSYKWAEVLDADAFTRFHKEGIFNQSTGLAFRHEILSKGNSEDPATLFRNFMGRDPDPDALLRRSGLLTTSA